jgi:hypothetical protein
MEEFLAQFMVSGIKAPELSKESESSVNSQCSPSEGDGCGGSGDCNDGCDDGC